MKKLWIYTLLFCLPFAVAGQGWVTKDAHVVVKDDAHVVVSGADGHYTNKGTGLIFTKNAGTFHVFGNWVNNGSTPAIGNNQGTVILTGGTQGIMGTTPTSFNNLELAGTGDKTLYVDALVGGGYTGSRNGSLALNNRHLALNTKLLIINRSSPAAINRGSGLLIGDTDPTTGYGKVQWNIRNSGSGNAFSIPFGTTDFIYIPLVIEVETTGVQSADSGFVSVATYPTNPALAPNNRPFPIGILNLDNEYGIENDIKTVDRFYVMDGNGYSTNPTLSFGFSYVDREWGGTNLLDEAHLEAARYDATGNAWNYTLKGSTDATANHTRSGSINNYLGAWILHNSPYCPVANFTFRDDCFKIPITFTDSSYIEKGVIDTTVWLYENIVTENQNAITNTFGAYGSYDVIRKVRGDRGCWDTIIKTVEVFPLPVSRFSYNDTCFTDRTQFASTSTSAAGMPLSHNWNINGANYSTDNFTHGFTSVGVKSIRLETENTLGCRDTLLETIEIEPLPEVGFTFENICERQEAFFIDETTTKGSIDEWKWDVNGRTVSFLQNHSQIFNIPGIYPAQLRVKNSFGCIDSIERKITVYPRALARFNQYPKEVYITEPYVNLVQDGANANSWEWRFGDLSDDEFGPEVFHQYPDTGLFSARLIANNEFGCADTFYRTILIKPDLKIFIPNAFSPGTNNDVNTTFKPGGTLHGLKAMEMDIYTRWGELIYHTEDINQPWDGIYQGEYVQNGTYLYVIKVKDIYNDVFHYSGTVTVVK